MTDVADDDVELSDDFQDRVFDVLLRLKTEDPATDETVNMVAKVAASAEERETPYWVISLKYFHLQALQGAGRIDEALVEFPKFLSYCDRHPEGDKGEYLLTVYKWMVYYARLFPQVSKERIEGLLRDFEERLRRAGISQRPLHQARMNWAMTLGRIEEATRQFREWQASARDGVSDCPACELNDRVEYLIFLGQDEDAVCAASPLLAGDLKCTSVPDRTYGTLLAPHLRLSRRDEALNLHHQGYRRIAGKRRYVASAAEHITFLVKAGELEEAARVFESFLPLALETTTPLKKFCFLLAGWLLLDRRRTAGFGAAGLKLPASFDALRREGSYDLEALTGWFRSETLELARSFDERDETDAYSRRIAAAFGN